MNPDHGEDPEGLARGYALLDGVLHGGRPQVRSVMAKLLGDHPELRPRAGEVGPLAARAVREVSTMSPEAQARELAAEHPHLVTPEEVATKAGPAELPPLEGVRTGGLVMRFAPGPSGPLHLGHSRAVILNDEYCKRYAGKFILRLEDTNPAAVDPGAYDMIRADLDWLGVKVGQEVVQSDRLELYHDWARRMLEQGHGYVCTCAAELWRRLKDSRRACPHREEPPEVQLDRYTGMHQGAFAEGQASVVVKTDLDHPNPAVRDFVALRISDVEHPRRPNARVWPVMNFSVAVDDHELGLTHVLRGKDHLNNTLRQEYLFNYFHWVKPRYIHYGFVKIPQVILKTSSIRKGLNEGNYLGWDDVRLGTLLALRRRGYQAETLRRFWVEAGIHEVEFTLAWENLNALNKELVEPRARRYFFVPQPQWFTLEGPEGRAAPGKVMKRAPLLPGQPEAGFREEEVGLGSRVALTTEDTQLLFKAIDSRVRLKNLCNATLEQQSLKYTGREPVKGVPIVQWACDHVPMTLTYPDGRVVEGVAEPGVSAAGMVGQVVQFERVGFVRLEAPDRAAFLHG